MSSGDRFDVESGHGSGFSIGEGCRDCEQGRFHCETSTNAGTDCDGDGDGPGGTSDIPIPGLTGSVAHTTSGSDKARLWQPKRAMDDCISPILIDLEHDGFLFGGGENPVSFDMFGDGNPIVMNWVVPAGDDAFLVRDANGNGLADHGGELFGNGTWMMLEERFAPNGFVGLSQFDDPALGGNSDGLITDADEVWQSLMLWVDLDADGVCDVSEMLHLNEAGLARLETIPKSSRRRDRHGNLLKYTADAFRYEGPRLKMVDVFFQIH